MIVSSEQGLDFLNKFIAGSRSLVAVTRGAFGELCFECFIISLSAGLLCLRQHPRSAVLGQLNIPSVIHLDRVTAFEYGDLREADLETRQGLQSEFVDIEGVLTMRFGDSDALLIIEYVDDWEDVRES